MGKRRERERERENSENTEDLFNSASESHEELAVNETGRVLAGSWPDD